MASSWSPGPISTISCRRSPRHSAAPPSPHVSQSQGVATKPSFVQDHAPASEKRKREPACCHSPERCDRSASQKMPLLLTIPSSLSLGDAAPGSSPSRSEASLPPWKGRQRVYMECLMSREEAFATNVPESSAAQPGWSSAVSKSNSPVHSTSVGASRQKFERRMVAVGLRPAMMPWTLVMESGETSETLFSTMTLANSICSVSSSVTFLPTILPSPPASARKFLRSRICSRVK